MKIKLYLNNCPLCNNPPNIEELKISENTFSAKIICYRCGLSLDCRQEFKIGSSPNNDKLIIPITPTPFEIWNKLTVKEGD